MGVIAALVQFHDWLHVLLVLGVFVIGHLIEGYVLVPKLVGDKIGLHPVAVIFAILAGGELFGFLGVLLALPVAAVVMVVLRWVHERYTASTLYGAATVDGGAIATASADPVDSADAIAGADPADMALIADDTPSTADPGKPS
jgi:hypothetical protein